MTHMVRLTESPGVSGDGRSHSGGRARRRVPLPRVNSWDLPAWAGPGRGQAGSDVEGGRASTLRDFQD
jgi:hypothetical protein